MAKSKAMVMTPDALDDEQEQRVSRPAIQPVATVELPTLVETVMIEVPLCNQVDAFGYVSNNVDVNLTQRDHIRGWHRIVAGLRARNERTLDKRPVHTGADAVRWLIEKLGA